MYIKLNQIQEIQLDHTSRCNLTCPQCARTNRDWFKDEANRGLDLNIDDYKLLLEPFPKESLRLFHCGNYGDALASPTFDQTFDFCLKCDVRSILIATNGSLRSEEWWRDLALRGGQKLKVIFSIDGLGDTNGIYRQGANWLRIIKNVKAFVSAGGWARWDFIEFAHNYHQIEEARQLANELGFKVFNVKYTARFASQGLLSETTNRGLELKDQPGNVNQKDVTDIMKAYGSFEEYVDKTPIRCKYQAGFKVFVDMHMRLWPCCWFGAPSYFKKLNEQKKSFVYLNQLYGEDFNNLRQHGWKVLEHEFFTSYLERSWNAPSDRYRRIYTCGRTCGEKFEFSSGYGQNTNKEVLR